MTNKLIIILFLVTTSCVAQEYNQNTIFRPESTVSDTDTLGSTEKGIFDGNNTVDDWLKVNSINLYGAGQILGLASGEDQNSESVSPSGSLGINFSTTYLACNIFYMYDEKKQVDLSTLKQYGATLMNPGRSGHTFSISLDANLNRFIGIRSSFQVVDNQWKLSDDIIVDASPHITKLGVYCRPFQFDLDSENKLDFTVDIMYTNRSIAGDFQNLKQRLIEGRNIENRGYNGWEINASLRFNSLKFNVQFSGIKIDGGNLMIPEFSGNQVQIGLTVTGKILKIK